MATSTQVVWHGSQQESFDLINSIARNCTCEFGMMGVRLSTCTPHLMLMDDQRALDGLLFMRRMSDRLRREEFTLVDASSEETRVTSIGAAMEDRQARREQRLAS